MLSRWKVINCGSDNEDENKTEEDRNKWKIKEANESKEDDVTTVFIVTTSLFSF